jgi:16S rRNA processing protein RimM
MDTDTVQIGEVVAAHGLDGGLKVYPTSDHAERWAEWLSAVIVDRLGPEPRPARVARVAGGLPVLRVEGIEDRTAAERLVGAVVWVPTADLPRLGADEFYWFQLVGLLVTDRDGRPAGRVRHVRRTGAHDVIEVEQGSRRALVPFVRAWVELDWPAGRLRLLQDPLWEGPPRETVRRHAD